MNPLLKTAIQCAGFAAGVLHFVFDQLRAVPIPVLAGVLGVSLLLSAAWAMSR